MFLTLKKNKDPWSWKMKMKWPFPYTLHNHRNPLYFRWSILCKAANVLFQTFRINYGCCFLEYCGVGRNRRPASAPGSLDDVVIGNGYTMSTSGLFSVNSIVVQSGGTMTVNSSFRVIGLWGASVSSNSGTISGSGNFIRWILCSVELFPIVEQWMLGTEYIQLWHE